MQAEDEPKIDPKHEPNETYPGLSHPTSLKLMPKRVPELCLRTTLLHKGNALSALGRNKEARETYELVLPLLKNEPRTTRLDWERVSIILNIGNTYMREGNFAKAYEQYEVSKKLGQDHVDSEFSNKAEGLGIVAEATRFESFCLKKEGKEEEAKKRMAEVIAMKARIAEEEEKQKATEAAMLEKQEAEEKKLAEEQEKASNPAIAAS
jgi:tetratricopeptide (TPR) repeat protein